jgi:hypothetical protein
MSETPHHLPLKLEQLMRVVDQRRTGKNESAPVALGMGCGRAGAFGWAKDERADSMSLKRSTFHKALKITSGFAHTWQYTHTHTLSLSLSPSLTYSHSILTHQHMQKQTYRISVPNTARR